MHILLAARLDFFIRFQKRTRPHPYICTCVVLPNVTTWQGFCDSFWTLSELLSLSEILISRHVLPAGASKLSQGLSTIVTFNYSFSACHHESASLGHRRSLHACSDWLIWPGQESKFRSLEWDAERIWQGLQVWCNRTCSFWNFLLLQLQEEALRMCPRISVLYWVFSVPQGSQNSRVGRWCGINNFLCTKLCVSTSEC